MFSNFIFGLQSASYKESPLKGGLTTFRPILMWHLKSPEFVDIQEPPLEEANENACTPYSRCSDAGRFAVPGSGPNFHGALRLSKPARRHKSLRRFDPGRCRQLLRHCRDGRRKMLRYDLQTEQDEQGNGAL